MFKQARLKLTAWYLLIIILVSGFFSVLVYRTLAREVERFDRRHRFLEWALVEETKHRILINILKADAMIWVAAGALGYFLAGRTLKPISDMVDEQNRFISDASHELRTPLTALKSSMEVYLRDKKPTLADVNTLITESVDEVNKLQTLSDSLLQLAQFQKPNGVTLRESLSLAEVVREAVRKIQPAALQKNVLIKTKLENVSIKGDKFSVIDLVTILLDNAVKYSPEGKMVTVKVLKKDRTAQVIVSDQGIGISEKDLPHIWDRFYRADASRTRGGYGLGLAIAKKIAETNGGILKAESQLNKGSTFTVSFQI
ncbi:MAG: Integral membrane sensor signal transduction histidine kinase [Candidatus Amesbacteria bacterium GW2011_GWB1_47_26]|uniref:histidine kinase n=1 Tax=Candidatus Amesbacteria bacterium GW2011_GWC2_45_19 TaxID=1618366 RepID=A0A0G1M5J0_9BACT|nr:MAG: Integral membrane sensor signal transduction histidine kinase [Candidatus Amesbacteria bacterium GW2011_GWC2_45_19]KKU38551.1 MAG: Integral membrane sensor signal transduction histidine kinase [Candidatus Amesbacteria bacterium GW2011_GWA1_46_35]KKU69628.1 MAG: Integral membrane sensor signal transduction histidine kinase [Microgenomates group bacterium GW2011_GWC1_47_20]KKU74606.1 MAG: Integral membrane sensor signal transduction histidine kinase [Candidatus Amesbacteria bacterium GW201